MMKHVILVRSSAFKTQRLSRQARYLLNEGYKVTIISWSRHSSSNAEQNTRNTLEKLGAKIVCFDYVHEYGKGIFGIYPRIKWVIFLANFINNQMCDFVCFVDLDSMIASFLIKRIKRTPVFIADFADFIEEYPIKYASIVRPIIEVLNKIIFNSFEYILVPNEQRLKYYMRDHDKVKVINNAPDIELNIKSSRNGAILYCGTLGPDRGIGLICDAIDQSCNLKFRVAGWGPFEKELLQREGSQLTYLNHIDYTNVLLETAECDFVYCVYDPSISVNKFSDPNKFYEAIYFGKPLIVARGTGIDLIVEEAGIGIVIDYNSKSLIESVESISQLNYDTFVNNINLCKMRFSSALNNEKLKEIYT